MLKATKLKSTSANGKSKSDSKSLPEGHYRRPCYMTDGGIWAVLPSGNYLPDQIVALLGPFLYIGVWSLVTEYGGYGSDSDSIQLTVPEGYG